MNCREVQHGSDEYRQTVVLRDKILRFPLGLRTQDDELEAERSCYHLARWDHERIVGCLLLQPLTSSQIKMRQVAVDTDFQGRGIGTELVAYSESFARQHGFSEMVMHARDEAVPFYERLGYATQGEQFIEVTIPHFKMHKTLT